MKNAVQQNSKEWIYGAHATLSALKNPCRQWAQLFLTPTAKKNLVEKFEQSAFPFNWNKKCIHEVNSERIDSLLAETVLHQGFLLQAYPLESPSLKDFLDSLNPQAIILLLDGLTDPHNVGAILRSAAALNADGIITTHYHSVPQTATLTKIASGAVEYIPYIKVPNLSQAIEILKKENFWCYGLAEEGKASLLNVTFPQRVGLVLGSEDKGIRPLVKKQCDELLHLPTCKTFTTLNVSNAAALALYEVAKQIGKLS